MSDVSLLALSIERVIKNISNFKGKTEEELVHEVNELRNNRPEEDYELSKIVRLKSHVNRQLHGENPVYYLSSEGESDKVIMYLHGGGYIHEISSFHFRAIDRLVQATNAVAIVPIYTRIPHGTYWEALSLIEDIYTTFRSENPDKKLILMGDSAGGGLALAFMEYLATKDISQPDKAILFSPWVDVNTNNPDIEEYVEKDIWLDKNISFFGKLWAGDTDTYDYRVSPLFGDVSRLQNITIFTGTKEILYPDTLLMYEKLKAAGVDTELIVGEDMLHVYPVLPIPEGREALKKCAELIKD